MTPAVWWRARSSCSSSMGEICSSGSSKSVVLSNRRVCSEPKSFPVNMNEIRDCTSGAPVLVDNATNQTSIICLASYVPHSATFCSWRMSSSVPKTAVQLSENVTAKPSAAGFGNQFCGAQARNSAGIEGSSCTCFVHISVMLGVGVVSSVVELVDTWNRATDPTLLAIANRFLCLG